MIVFILFRFLKDKLEGDAKSVEDEYKAIQCESMQCLARECAEADVIVDWRTTDRCRESFFQISDLF